MPLQEGASKDKPWRQELPVELARRARESRAFQRARLSKSADELLEVVLLDRMADLSLREVAGVWAGRGTPLSDEAVRQRLAACPQWLAGLVSQLFPVRAPAPSGGGQWRLVICDGSSIKGPGSTGTEYRWPIAYEPGAQQVAAVQGTDGHTGESLTRDQLGPGVVGRGDRNFAKAPALVAARAQGAHLVIRRTPQYLKLWTRKGGALDLGAALRAARGQQRLSFAAQGREERSGQVMAVWVQAPHLTAQQINRARRRVKRQAARNGRTPRAQTLWLSEWGLVLTTSPPAELSAEVILELYRVRWQVELVIKRYKSLLAAARVRAKRGSPLAEVYLLGKLVFALLVERRAIARLGTEWGQMLHARQATWWRVWQLLAQEWIATLLNPVTWREWDWPAVLRVLAERPRKRALQVVPAAVVQWLKTRPLLPLPQAA